jgi:biotin carboxyl carrier protein
LAAYRAYGGQRSSTAVEDRQFDDDRAYDYLDSGYSDGPRSDGAFGDHGGGGYSSGDYASPGLPDELPGSITPNRPLDQPEQLAAECRPDEFQAADEPAADEHAPAEIGPQEPGRRLAPSPLFRGRAVFAAVTLGAITAAAAGQSLMPHAPKLNIAPASQPQDVAVMLSTDGDVQQSYEVQPAARVIDAAAQVAQLTATQRMTGEATTAAYVKPANGPVISGYGGSYGTMHYGVEIAGSKDAPIYAAAAGTIIAAGPASGFGTWVKEQLSDGTVLVYARMDGFSVQVGQQVTAGQQIARMGDRGFSTGYTLHFEVWTTAGKKIDPEQWLNQRGIIL